MKERYSIIENTGGSITLNFNNGSIDIPSQPGAYIVSSGCGSGKTENIKSLLRHRHNEGVLYCVDTVKSLVNMYAWILAELVNTGIIGRDDVGILYGETTKLDDETKRQIVKVGLDMGRIMEDFKDDPNSLTRKKIILITHIRFWTTPPNLFLLYHTPSIGLFDGDFKSLLNRNDLRQWVIFDETPVFLKDYFTMPRYLLSSFTEYDKGRVKLKSRADIESSYKDFIKDTPADMFNTSTALGRLNKDTVFNLFPSYFDRWLVNKENEVRISFRPRDLCQEGINTHVIVFEGAGDVLFHDSGFTLLDIKDKYNGRVKFTPFEHHLKGRKEVPSESEYELMLEEVAKIIGKQSGKTLVVVWMNIGQQYKEDEDIEDGNSDTQYVMRVRSDLADRIDSEKFKVTYYGATDTKSINDYSDFENIILSGKWGVGSNRSINSFRMNWGSDTTPDRFRLWYFIQLICRIGIRRHDGKTYNVFYSTDFLKRKTGDKVTDDSLIPNLQKYFDNSLIIEDEVETEEWKVRLNSVAIDKRIKDNIFKLADNFPNLRDIISCDSTSLVEWRITPTELYSVIPNQKDRPHVTRYRKTYTEPFKKLGIKLVICDVS